MMAGSGWEASPWLVPVGVVAVCVVIVVLAGWLGRDLLFRSPEQRALDDAELRAAQQYIRLIDERWEPPQAAWETWWAEERQRQAEELAATGFGDPDPDPDPDLTAVLPDYVVEALNGHTSSDECADSIFARHGL